jgi:ribose/xylose/arabinose/galactoside ABC-type transport system permease subunit
VQLPRDVIAAALGFLGFSLILLGSRTGQVGGPWSASNTTSIIELSVGAVAALAAFLAFFVATRRRPVPLVVGLGCLVALAVGFALIGVGLILGCQNDGGCH